MTLIKESISSEKSGSTANSQIQVGRTLLVGAVAMLCSASWAGDTTTVTAESDDKMMAKDEHMMHAEKEGEETMQKVSAKHGDTMEHSMKDDDKMMAKHGDHKHHQFHDASTWQAMPELAVHIKADAASGWNVHLAVDNFQFAPESVNAEAVEGEGHAHLYVNEKKIARLYGPWFHLPAMEPGTHVVRVELNGNDHGIVANGAEPIQVIAEIVQK